MFLMPYIIATIEVDIRSLFMMVSLGICWYISPTATYRVGRG